VTPVLEVRVVVVDPLEVEGDALLRSVGEGLEGVTPLCRRIGVQAGEGILARLRGMGEAPVGAALVTPGGGISPAFLIHLVIRSADEAISPSGVARALRNALRQAAGWELDHLVLPPMGMGAGNLSAETAARVTLEVLREHADESPIPSRITIPVPGSYEEDLFVRERARVFPPGEAP
jgi:O-acetyl-ADP-ribose deacetylase (regulator of RNase III)